MDEDHPTQKVGLRKGSENMANTIPLSEIAHARSGDKGNHANVGVIAWTDAGYEYLGKVLTESRVAEFFLPLRPKQVQRYELPGIRAYNFMLSDVLGGGASRSLRVDSQGKTLGVAILSMEVPVPANIAEMLRS